MRWLPAAACAIAAIYAPQLAAIPGTPLFGHAGSLAAFWSFYLVIPGVLPADLLRADGGEWMAIAATSSLALLVGITLAAHELTGRLRLLLLASVALLSAFNAIGFGHALRS